jgi:hypothetical protein
MLRYSDRIETLNRAVNNMLARQGFIVQTGEDNCIGFIDGKNWRTTNPGDSTAQNAMYSGYLRGCGVKTMTAVGADRMTLFTLVTSSRAPDQVATVRLGTCEILVALARAVNVSDGNGGILSWSVYGDAIFHNLHCNEIKVANAPDKFTPAFHNSFPPAVFTRM